MRATVQTDCKGYVFEKTNYVVCVRVSKYKSCGVILRVKHSRMVVCINTSFVCRSDPKGQELC